MNQTLKVSLVIGQLVRRDGFACRDEGQRAKPDSPLWGLGSRMVKVNALPAPTLRGVRRKAYPDPIKPAFSTTPAPHTRIAC
jgi:hypothetical protein